MGLYRRLGGGYGVKRYRIRQGSPAYVLSKFLNVALVVSFVGVIFIAADYGYTDGETIKSVLTMIANV